MTLYDRLLVPTDGSPEGRRAVAHAIDLAAVHGAAVTAVYVVDTAKYSGLPMETSWKGIDQLFRSEAEDALETVESLAADRGVDVESTTVDGTPSAEICRLAETGEYDLIVMGTHGRGGIDRLLLGSVAEKVVRRASIPVLTVRVGDAVDEAATGDAEPGGTPATDFPTG